MVIYLQNFSQEINLAVFWPAQMFVLVGVKAIIIFLPIAKLARQIWQAYSFAALENPSLCTDLDLQWFLAWV